MKNQMKGKKGITLIALVITIVVLLILAGVTIATLTGDNGLLQKATGAKQANEEAAALEKIKVEVAGSYGLDGKIDKTQLINNLGKIQGLTYNNSAIDENTNISSLPVTVKLNGYAFTISENGDVDKIKWIDNNGSYTNAETGQTLTVGDTVKYENTLINAVNSTELEQLKTDLRNYSGDTSSVDNGGIARELISWKFLDVKDGKIRLITSNPTTKNIKLLGANGYNNAVYLLDKACHVLYSGNKGTAQNLKIEDIQNHLTYDYTQYENSNTDTGKYGGTKEYTSNLNYPRIYANEIGCKAISTLDNTGNNLGQSIQLNPATGSLLATDKLKATQTYWNKSFVASDFTDTKYYNIFINNGSNYPQYWLSSRCVQIFLYNACFRVHIINSNMVDNDYMYFSKGENKGYSCKFRPVVTLNSDVQLEPDGTNTWKIK